jgi:site-specific DNA-methyltransferase (adenine-specific)
MGHQGYTPSVGREEVMFNNKESLLKTITAPTTDLAKKYDGFKYSIAPLKQVVETIMVFQKPYKTGSCLHDVLAYENGDNECTVGALDIDGNRVGTENTQRKNNVKGIWSKENFDKQTISGSDNGRFPSQAFVTNETAEILDKQSGITTSSGGNGSKFKSEAVNTFTIGKKEVKNGKYGMGLGDTGGASKILHKCNYEDADLFVYEPKVSASERNAGCENLDKKQYSHDGRETEIENAYQRNNSVSGNNHPTLKPITLNYQLTKLFKTPNEQTVLVPFSGAGSELIGLFKAGFENIKGCELNPEFVEIAKARVKHHCEDLFNQNVLM